MSTSIPIETIRNWVREHGLDPNQVESFSIQFEFDSVMATAILAVQMYRLNAEGHRYAEYGDENAATDFYSLPLRSWPPLSEQDVA